MKPIQLLTMLLLAVLIICAVFSSRLVALYYQIEGGELLGQVLREAYPAIPCTLAPLTDPGWREQTASEEGVLFVGEEDKAVSYMRIIFTSNL